MLTRLFIIFLVFLGFGHSALADYPISGGRDSCDATVLKTVGDHFRLEKFSFPYPNGGDVLSGDCKPWPTDASRTLAAFYYQTDEQKYPGYVVRQFVLLLALVDVPSQRVIASYRSEPVEEDAVTWVDEYSARLDTARYTLSKTTRAFALRSFTFHGPCAASGGWTDDLTLFVVAGKKLRPVLSQTMSHWKQGGSGSCGSPIVEDDPPVDVQADIFIAVEKTATHGLADLRLSVKSDTHQNPPSMVIKYNGKDYDQMAWDKAFRDWWESVNP